MNDMNIHSFGELAPDAEFFAPMSSDLIDSLIGQYQAERTKVEQVDQFLRGQGFNSVVHYFIEGNRESLNGLRYAPSTERLFLVDPAIAALNASYWDRALKLTDVLDCMPQKRRSEWWDLIREHKTPEFEEESVRATLGDLMASRAKFFAERVDGIFRALSREHVTNRPEGFSKRMIIQRAIDQYGLINHDTCGYISDLRCIVARFMGRTEPRWDITRATVDAARRNPGEWMLVDGGALRIRVYAGVGTAHLEVHPDMAWRLNSILASLYPAAIPAKHREKPKRARKLKDFQLFDRPLPFVVVELLASMKPARIFTGSGYDRDSRIIPNSRQFERHDRDKATVAEAERVLMAIGGVQQQEGNTTYWQFSYDPQSVLDEIVCSGCIPDHKSHQFYPTPAGIAEKAVELAEINETHTCLEPSAGIGNLADRMFACAEITCVEISGLHCEVLRQKGFHVDQADFTRWRADRRFDRIVMNPPFSEGRWRAHLEMAAELLEEGGRLVAILPASAKNKDLLPGLSLSWSRIFENEFAGASVDTVILVADAPNPRSMAA